MPLSWNQRTLTSWNPLGHSRPVTGLLYLLTVFSCLTDQRWLNPPPDVLPASRLAGAYRSSRKRNAAFCSQLRALLPQLVKKSLEYDLHQNSFSCPQPEQFSTLPSVISLTRSISTSFTHLRQYFPSVFFPSGFSSKYSVYVSIPPYKTSPKSRSTSPNTAPVNYFRSDPNITLSILFSNTRWQFLNTYGRVSQPLWDRGPVNYFFIRRGPGPNKFNRKYLSTF